MNQLDDLLSSEGTLGQEGFESMIFDICFILCIFHAVIKFTSAVFALLDVHCVET